MKLLAFIVLLLSGLVAVQAQTPVQLAGLSFVQPKSWTSVTPESPIRVAQWLVPPLEKGQDAGEVVAFYFGPGQGGDTEANIKRWESAVTTPDGAPAEGDTSVRKTNGYVITQLLIFGTYLNTMTPAGVPAAPKRQYGLIGAVIDRPEGPVFFRFTGPEALVKSQLVTFTKFIDTIKPAK